MVDAHFVPYDDEVHRDKLYELYLEYGTWTKNQLKVLGINYEQVIGGNIKKVLDNFFERVRIVQPPEGFIYILEVDGETAGTGRLSKLEDGICELNNMYIRPKFRGMGFGKEILKQLEDKAWEFGYSTLRLDTSPEYMPAAVHIYRRAGFKERGPYSSQQRVATYDSEDGSKYYRMKTYMEKEL